MNSTHPSHKPVPAPNPRSRSGFALRQRPGAFAFAALPIAGLVLVLSAGARLSSNPAARAALNRESENRRFEWAVVDRLEPVEEPGSVLAVLLAGDGETEHVVGHARLPEGASPGVWLRILETEDGALSFEIDEKRTREVRARVEAKLKELQTRKSR